MRWMLDEPPMRLPDYDPNVLSAIRDMHSQDPTVLQTDEIALQGMLADEGYLDYWPSIVAIGAALEVLAIEQGMENVA